ncbi:STN domain-containing protein [Rhodopseudomonas sp. AAP120]|uniref:STN domain-containing protein n=1 Tax=Rhodopseudomonas sp. AAP120 TaxID=1523430 RepID=UPI0006B96542|nr:STN domain-containing protein [Rhodopseudomonas sp. AAP120]
MRLLYVVIVALWSFGPASAEPFIRFDIPAAPLDVALAAFGRVTKEQLLVDAAGLDGRRSSPVIGRFTPEAALRQMLVGTGLGVQAIEGQGFAVAAAGSQAADEVIRNAGAASRFTAFSALIQAASAKALCVSPDTAPGSYRVMARLWIGGSGVVERAELLTSSGDLGRDARLTDTFRHLGVGIVPAGLPQPVTLLITSERATPDYCAKLIASDKTLPAR